MATAEMVTLTGVWSASQRTVPWWPLSARAWRSCWGSSDFQALRKSCPQCYQLEVLGRPWTCSSNSLQSMSLLPMAGLGDEDTYSHHKVSQSWFYFQSIEEVEEVIRISREITERVLQITHQIDHLPVKIIVLLRRSHRRSASQVRLIICVCARIVSEVRGRILSFHS